MQRHQYAFFGQKTGMLFDSGEQVHPNIYLRFIKKKETGVWEKPSQKEGKAIKFNLLEIISILTVAYGKNQQWSTVHQYKGNKTSISIKYTEGKMVFFIDKYAKPLSQVENHLFRDLLKHVYEEKIEFATSSRILDPVEESV